MLRLVWDKTDFYSIHYFLFLPWGYTRFLTTTCSGLNWNFFCTCTFRNDYPNSSTSFFFFFWIICLFVFYFCIQVSSKKLLHCWYFDTQVKCGLKTKCKQYHIHILFFFSYNGLKVSFVLMTCNEWSACCVKAIATSSWVAWYRRQLSSTLLSKGSIDIFSLSRERLIAFWVSQSIWWIQCRDVICFSIYPFLLLLSDLKESMVKELLQL